MANRRWSKDDYLDKIKNKREIENKIKELGIGNLTVAKQIYRMWKNGNSNTEIAQEMGVHLGLVNKYIDKLKNVLESEHNYLMGVED